MTEQGLQKGHVVPMVEVPSDIWSKICAALLLPDGATPDQVLSQCENAEVIAPGFTMGPVDPLK